MSQIDGVICMAVYHPGARLLREQIDSLKAQTTTNWVCIVGVDGRDPKATEMLSALIDGDGRFEVHEFDQRIGFYRNFERILSLAPRDVDWLALADQDDRWYPDKLESLIPLLSRACMASGQARLARLDEEDTIVRSDRFTARSMSGLGDLIFDNPVSGALCVFRPDLLEIALPFPTETDVAYHDHWLGLCAQLMEGVEISKKPVQDYIQHARNVIGERQPQTIRRFHSLGRRAGFRGLPGYLVRHRWGWRVNMCRVALHRMPGARGTDRALLTAFAMNRLNLQLIEAARSAWRTGNASRLRIAALLFGSLVAPAFERNVDEPSRG